MKDKNTILLGLDGATLDLIKPWAEQGKLPNFKKIIGNGAYGTLKSSYPPITCPAWMCIGTGKSSETLNVFGPFDIDIKKKKININFRAKENYFWSRIEEPLIFNVPMIYPPKKADKRIITSNFGAGAGDFCYPKGLKKEVENKTNFFSLYKPITRSLRANLKRYEKAVNDNLELEIKTMKTLLKKDFNFFFGVTQATDHIQHMFFDKMDENDCILNVYKRIDKFLAYIFDKYPKSNIFLISDHGAGLSKGHFYLNNFLIKKGYLRLKEKKTRYILSKIGFTKQNLVKIANFLKLSGFLEKRIPKSVRQSIPSEGNKITFEEAVNKNMVNWNKTKAFSTQHGNLYLLDKKIKEELIKRLKGFAKQNKLKLKIKEIDKKSSKNPDLFVFIDDYAYSDIAGSFGGDKIIEKNLKPEEHQGNHRMNGIFMAYGDDIRNIEVKEAELIDIAPTMLHIFNIPIPKDMDGKVLKEIFKKDSELNHKIRYKIKTEENILDNLSV